MTVTITFFVTSWCPDCARSRRVLNRFGIPYDEVDIEKSAGAESRMRSLNGGSGKIPTIVLDSPDGRKTLIEPSDRELSDCLRGLQQTATA